MIFDLILTALFLLRRNYLTSIIQKISLMRFVLVGEDTLLYSFLYNLKYSYFDYDGGFSRLFPPDYI